VAAPNTGSSPLRYAPGMLRDGHIRSAPWPSPPGQAVQAAAPPLATARPSTSSGQALPEMRDNLEGVPPLPQPPSPFTLRVLRGGASQSQTVMREDAVS